MIDQHNIQYLRSLPKVGDDPVRPDTSENVFSSAFSSLIALARGSAGTAAVKALGEASKKLEEQLNRNIKPIEALNSELGTSTTVSAQIFQNFERISKQNGELLITNQQFVKSAATLNQILPGTLALLSLESVLTNDILKAQTKATEMLGVQSANAAAFNSFLLANKESAKDVYDELAQTANVIEATTGQTGVLKDMLDAVGATSAVTRMTFRGSADELAKAALQANRMGTTLDNVAASAKSMLDVESQIASEMEFQLLTGQNISQQTNEMRVAAFTGDLDRVAEIQKDLIEANYEALKGNPIAMEAFAKSIGMSTDQVAKQGETIKARNALLEETSKIPTLELNELLNQFNVDSIEKLAALEGEKGKAARTALEKKLGSDAKIIESFDKYVAATDTRTQEQLLENAITSLTNTISAVFGPENVKELMKSQYTAIEKFTSTSRDAIGNAEGAIQRGEDISGLFTSITDSITSAFDKETTKENIASSVHAGIERAFASSKYFKQLAQPDYR
jgi:endonuclease III